MRASLRAFVRGIIREQAEGQGQLALVVIGDDDEDFLGLGSILGGGEKMAVLYDAGAVLSDHDHLDAALKGAVKGMIQIGKPQYGCLGAWEVQKSAGPGFAKQLYTIAGALAPKHLLVPDRSQVSDPAKAAWQKQSGRKRYPLDNADAPKTPPKEDDCPFHEEEYLNFAYDYSGEGQQLIDQFGAVHEKAMKALVQKYGASEDDIRDAFKQTAKYFFAAKRAAAGFSGF